MSYKCYEGFHQEAAYYSDVSVVDSVLDLIGAADSSVEDQT